jgi:micrococcal nuclease
MRAMSFRRPVRSWKWTIPGLVNVALFAALANPPDKGVISPADFEYVQRVVDGDTLILGTGERVRLIGVDTPETKHPSLRLSEGKRVSSITTKPTII